MIDELVGFVLVMFGPEIADSVEKRNPEWRGCLLATSVALALIAGTLLLVVVWRSRH